MKIECIRDYLSVRPFGPIDLPDLTVLVGLNGSGKSHLLLAIEQRAVSTDIAPETAGQPLPQHWILRIENGGTAPAGLTTPAPAAIAKAPNIHPSPAPTAGATEQDHQIANNQAFLDHRGSTLAPFRKRIEELAGQDIERIAPGTDIWKLGPDEVCRRVANVTSILYSDEIQDLFSKARTALTKVQTAPPQHRRHPPPSVGFSSAISALANLTKKTHYTSVLTI